MDKETGRRLFAWRTWRGFTQQYVADSLGFTKQAISNYENARSAPSQESLAKIVELLGITMAQFWGELPPRKVA